jgi:hypothetical protein
MSCAQIRASCGAHQPAHSLPAVQPDDRDLACSRLRLRRVLAASSTPLTKPLTKPLTNTKPLTKPLAKALATRTRRAPEEPLMRTAVTVLWEVAKGARARWRGRCLNLGFWADVVEGEHFPLGGRIRASPQKRRIFLLAASPTDGELLSL